MVFCIIEYGLLNNKHFFLYLFAEQSENPVDSNASPVYKKNEVQSHILIIILIYYLPK